jgi:Transposase DDE domain
MKRTYKLRNWSEYNAALVKRGSLTLWLSDEVIEAWENAQKTGKPGASTTYSDLAIQTLLTFKVIYGLALRQTIGFAGAIFELMGYR